VELNSVERLRIFHDFFRQGEESEFAINLKRLMKSGRSFRDYICPDSFEFNSDYFKMGDQYGRVFFLKDYASYIKDSFVADLCSLTRNLFFSVDIIPVPTDEAVREIENKLLGVETNITNWQRRQNANNNFSAVIPYDLEQQRKETKEYLDDLTNRDQRMMFALVTMVLSTDSKEQLERDSKMLRSIAGKHLCQLSVLKYQQMDGLNTALPYGLRRINAMRTLTTESTAILMPFRAHEIMEPGGTYCGMNAISNNLIIANRKNLLNGNGFILGVSGSGKSFFSKREIVSTFLGTNDEIIIADPQNEYTPLVNALGGVAINLSPTSPTHINAMDLALGYGDSANPLIAKSEFVLSFIEQIMGGTGKLEAVDKSIIDRCLTKIYADYLDSGYTIDPPTLVDLHKELKKQKEKQAKELALALEMVSEGNLNMFAHQTNVDIHNRLISFGIRDLGKQLRTPGMLVMTDAIRNRVARNRERGIRTHVIMDEMHIFFANELSSQFFAESWKQFRKDGALATGITQNVEDCLRSVTARTMLANSEYLVLLNQAPTDQIELAKLLNISDNQMSHVDSVGFGRGLIKCGSNIVPFVDNFPKDTKLYRLMSTKPEEMQKNVS
jgi:type IV secretory pathway VirB4 component